MLCLRDCFLLNLWNFDIFLLSTTCNIQYWIYITGMIQKERGVFSSLDDENSLSS